MFISQSTRLLVVNYIATTILEEMNDAEPPSLPCPKQLKRSERKAQSTEIQRIEEIKRTIAKENRRSARIEREISSPLIISRRIFT